MRIWLTILALALGGAAVAARASAATLSEAREAEEEGRWGDAVEAWKELSALGEENGGAEGRRLMAGYLRVLGVTGRWDALESESARLGARFPTWDQPVLHHARVLAHRGEVEEAIRLLEGTGSWEARLDRADLLHRLGRHDAARALTAEALAAYDPAAPVSSRETWVFGRAAADQGDFEGAARLYETAYRDSLDFVEARISLAYLFQEKYQEHYANEELVELERLVPLHPDFLLAVAVVSARSGKLSRAEPLARRVLETRPEESAALAIIARDALVSDMPDEALRHASEVLERDPTDLVMRSLAAAAHYLKGDSTAYHREVDRVLAQDPVYYDVYLDLADILRMSRRHEECFRLYDRVLAREPDHPGALIAKGFLLMREGQESEARAYLEKGFEGDAFNLRAWNQLELLDKMDTFAVYRTENFEIRMEAEKDSMLVPLLKDRLEDIYRELVDSHGWAPEVPTIIELMPSHDWFSARVTGLPWIGGIPAVCFGDVVAMDSPRYLAGGLNWVDVLRHEYGHVLALGMTRKKVPFWFTEGLSVYLEHFPRDEKWDANLVGHYVDHALVPLDSLTIAFTRPRSHAQRLLAYHESSLIIQDLVDRKGWKCIPQLLREFGEGKSLDAALRKVTGESLEDLGRRSMEVIRAEAASLGVWPAPERQRLARLQGMEEEHGEDVEFLELLALTRHQFQLLDEANATAEKILELDPENPRANGIIGLGYRLQDRTEEARTLLERAASGGSRDVPVHVALAEMAVAEGDTAAALDHYAEALAIYPRGHEVRRERARLLAARGETEAARGEYRTLVSQNASSGTGAVELARLALDAGDGEAAAAALDYALEVLPLDADVTALRGRALLLLDRDREAYDLFLRARRLDLRSIESMVGMGQYYLKHEDYDEAAYFAELALKYQPDHPTAQEILRLARAE